MALAAHMVVLAKVVEAGSFSAAARALGQTRAAVSKQIAGLEAEVGAQLLNRTTRRMSLTEVGRAFYPHCSRVAAETVEGEQVVASMQGAARGLLRISVPVTFGRRYVAPLLTDFLETYPEIELDLRLSDTPPDMIAERFDVGIRIGALRDSALGARRLAPSRRVVCASPAYLARRGLPQTPLDLRDHNCLLYSQLDSPALWRFRNRNVRVSGNFSVDNGESLRQTVIDGLGIAYMPTFIVGADLASGRLRSVLEPWVQSRQQIYAVYPRSRNLLPKVRAFVDYLAERFGPDPPWDRRVRPPESEAEALPIST